MSFNLEGLVCTNQIFNSKNSELIYRLGVARAIYYLKNVFD